MALDGLFNEKFASKIFRAQCERVKQHAKVSSIKMYYVTERDCISAPYVKVRNRF